MRTRPLGRSRPFAFSGPGRRSMPSRTLTPDPSAAPGAHPARPPTAPATAPPRLLLPLTAPPRPTLWSHRWLPRATPCPTGHPTSHDPLLPPAPHPCQPPAFPGLRLVTVPAGWPPYDCESHGAACPAAREVRPAVRRPASPRGRRRHRSTRADRVVSGVQRPAASGGRGPGHRVAQAIRPGDRGDTGGLPVAAADSRLDDGTRPGPDRSSASRSPRISDP